MRSKAVLRAVYCLAILTAGVGAAATSSAADPPPTAQTVQFDIKPQSLASALNALALQSHQQILFTPEIAKGKTTHGVKGALTADAALGQLLIGTGLSSSRSADGMILVSQADAKGASASSGPPSAPSGASNDQSPSKSTPTQGPTRLEEVIVTAQKRKERLIDVPESVTVLNPDTLTAQGALQLRDYADRIPGVSLDTQGAGFTKITIRGLTTGYNSDVLSSTAIYVDEVPFGSSTIYGTGVFTSLETSLFDMERIEVLKGPQGTLYGADAMGGLIKYVTKPPSTERFGGQAQVGLASTVSGGLSYNAAASVNAPLVDDKLALRASSWYSRDGGYIDNLALGQKDVDRSGIYGGRLDLLYTPTDKLSVRLAGFLQNISRDGTGLSDYDLSGRPVDGSLDQRRLIAEPYYQRFRLVSATVTYNLDWARLISISGYQTLRQAVGVDGSFAIPAYQPFSDFYGFTNGLSKIANPQYVRSNKFTQELRLSSERRGPLEWVIGGFYTHEGASVDAYTYFFDLDGQPTGNSNATTAVFSAPTSFSEYAPFGTLTWHLTDKIDVSGGLRYSHSAQTVSDRSYSTQPYDTVRSSDSVFTYLADARYHLSDRASAYLRYATGSRPGGPNFPMFDVATGLFVAQPPFTSDHLKSYEIGFKGETEDRRVGIEAAAFYLDWSDIQLYICDINFCGVANAPGGARIPGAELALTARPIRALTLASALTYLDGRLKQANATLGAAKNERLPDAPPYTASLSADYTFANKGLRPTLGADLRYVPDRRASFGGSIYSPQYRLPVYTVVNLHAGLTLGRVETQLYVRNIFDERGQLSAYTGLAVAPYNAEVQTTIIQPRTIGVTASTRF
jgi:outer membrane receptor protein involved in Fe transport